MMENEEIGLKLVMDLLNEKMPRLKDYSILYNNYLTIIIDH